MNTFIHFLVSLFFISYLAACGTTPQPKNNSKNKPNVKSEKTTDADADEFSEEDEIEDYTAENDTDNVETLPKPVTESPVAATPQSVESNVTTAAPPIDVPALNSVHRKKLFKSVFEVVIPKRLDKRVVYSKPLPMEKLPFKQRNEKFVSIGTAFYIGKGQFVSASHVFDPIYYTKFVDYKLRDVNGKVFDITNVLQFNYQKDVIVFATNIPQQSIQPLEVANTIEVGDPVYTVGNALGEGISIRGGEVASFTPEEDDGEWNYIRFSSPASPGNSGGPLIDFKGRVVGVVTKKSSNENLNYATPIKELATLSKNTGVFYIKNSSATYMNYSLEKVWNYNAKLPAPLSDFLRTTNATYTKFKNSMWKEFAVKYKKELAPYDPSLEQLQHKNQIVTGNGVGFISKEENTGWTVSKTDMKMVAIDSTEEEVISFNDFGSGSYAVEVSPPKKVKYGDFVKNPKMILDQILKGLSWEIAFLNEKIKVISYGKPDKVEFKLDMYGRAWTKADWLLDTGTWIALECTPTPGAAFCYFDNESDAYYGFTGLENSRINPLVLNYVGQFKHWREFLALDKKYLPKQFHNSQLTYAKNKSIKGQLGPIKIDFAHKDLNDLSYLMYLIKPHWKNKQLSLDFGSLTVMDSQNSQKISMFTHIYAPNKRSPKEDFEKWSSMLKRKPPYHGELYTSGDYALMVTPHKARTPAASNAKASKEMYVQTCTSKSSNQKSSTLNWCKTSMKAFQAQ
jgi:serine protease Do